MTGRLCGAVDIYRDEYRFNGFDRLMMAGSGFHDGWTVIQVITKTTLG